MTWFVKARDADGTVRQILCDSREQVAENIIDQEKRGRDVWVEDTQGRVVDKASFQPEKL